VEGVLVDIRFISKVRKVGSIYIQARKKIPKAGNVTRTNPQLRLETPRYPPRPIDRRYLNRCPPRYSPHCPRYPRRPGMVAAQLRFVTDLL
jgi:hypothetical protein